MFSHRVSAVSLSASGGLELYRSSTDSGPAKKKKDKLHAAENQQWRRSNTHEGVCEVIDKLLNCKFIM